MVDVKPVRGTLPEGVDPPLTNIPVKEFENQTAKLDRLFPTAFVHLQIGSVRRTPDQRQDDKQGQNVADNKASAQRSKHHRLFFVSPGTGFASEDGCSL